VLLRNLKRRSGCGHALVRPVAVKIVSPQISHKTEVAGVRLNLASAVEVERAAQALATNVAKAVPNAQLDGFLVQEMVTGTEVILGAGHDLVLVIEDETRILAAFDARADQLRR
jgi:acetyltransferase